MNVFGGTPQSEERLAATAAGLAEESSTPRFVAYRDGEAVGSAGCTVAGDVLRLWGGACLPEARGRGVYRALLDHRLRVGTRRRVPDGPGQGPGRDLRADPAPGRLRGVRRGAGLPGHGRLTWTSSSEIWDQITSQQPVPAASFVLATGFVALVLVLFPATWPRVRLGVTVVHEAGHAVVAVLVGRRLSAIRLHSDTSGLTVSKGKPRGPGMVAMLAAGYLAPALLGLLAAFLLADGRGVLLLWLLLLLLAGLLVWVRNGYGLLVLLVGGGALFALTWWGSDQVQAIAAYLVAWLLLLAAPRPLLELLASGRRRRRTSDPDQLADLTHVPAVVWMLVLLVASCAGLFVGVGMLAPELV